MTYTHQEVCRICNAKLPPPFLNLGIQPLANNLCATAYERAPSYPLALTRCPDCGLVQLTGVVDPGEMFSEYLYTPSQSSVFRKHFSDMAVSLTQELSLYVDAYRDNLVVDIGSNDGLLLSSFKAAGQRVVGVEPAANLAREANAAGIPTVQEFWSADVAQGICQIRGQAQLITATNVFAHCNDLHGFLKAVDVLLAADGALVIEVPSLPVMVRDGTFDLVYHEHLSYFALAPLRRLLADHDMMLFMVKDMPIHGGSYRLYVQRVGGAHRAAGYSERELTDDDFTMFADRARVVRSQFTQAVKRRQSVAGYGAPAKATVLLNYCGLTRAEIAYVVDDSPLKQGKFIPGTDGIPIVSREYAEAHPVESMVCFPWNLAESLKGKMQGLCKEVLVPMPTLRSIPLAEGVRVG